jgi:glycosyltransferase involved in cell wall biosynthesis
MSRIRAAFVMEQTLGHVTHTRNLTRIVAEQIQVVPTWLPVPFGVEGPGRLVPVFRENWSVRASWRARRTLTRALAVQPHDVIFFHTQVTALFSRGTMRRLPTVVSLDATPINYDSVGRYYRHRAAGDGWLDRQKFRLNREVFQAAKALVTWSDWARRSLIDDYQVEPGRINVIAPGAAPEYFEIGRERLARSTRRPERDPVRLLFVGGDFHRKGGPALLDCMRGPLGDRCELDIVTREAVEPRPGVRVHRGLGPNSPELLRLFSEADVFVLPSRADCLAVVLMEATAAGLPVVTTDVGALREAIQPGTTGLLVPAGDDAALCRALETLVTPEELRRSMGQAAHALASRRFDAGRNGRAVLELLTDAALAGRAARRAA